MVFFPGYHVNSSHFSLGLLVSNVELSVCATIFIISIALDGQFLPHYNRIDRLNQ